MGVEKIDIKNFISNKNNNSNTKNYKKIQRNY